MLYHLDSNKRPTTLRSLKLISIVSVVGNDRFVFNIKGNEYRPLTMIQFDIHTFAKKHTKKPNTTKIMYRK